MATVENPFRSAGSARGGRIALAAALAGVVVLVLLRTAGAPWGAAAAAGVAAAGAALLALWPKSGPSVGGGPPGEVVERFDPPYALVLESLSDPVLLASDQGEQNGEPRLLFANRAARELLRLQRSGGLLAAHIRNPQVLEAVEEALHGRIESEALFEEGGALDRVWRAIAKPLPSEGAERLALLCMRDETDARRNERMRADFLANASHELRTPLASLAGFIETLRGHAKDDVAARDRFLAIMTQQAQRMSRLIDDLLSLSRIELNEHIAPAGALDLGVAVTDVLDALGPIAADKSVRIAPRIPAAGAAMIVGDRDQIIQVIQNLVDNAIKYAGEGGVVTIVVEEDVDLEGAIRSRSSKSTRLSLLTPDRGRPIRYATLTVTDSGPGIAREFLPRLSERFYRVEGQKGGYAGTGLGLAIVKHIVNRHRGGLMVESAEGQGAAFTAYFPRPGES
jgi:two-component system phosphate regulon sensor histidine kinase PhoR